MEKTFKSYYLLFFFIISCGDLNPPQASFSLNTTNNYFKTMGQLFSEGRMPSFDDIPVDQLVFGKIVYITSPNQLNDNVWFSLKRTEPILGDQIFGAGFKPGTQNEDELAKKRRTTLKHMIDADTLSHITKDENKNAFITTIKGSSKKCRTIENLRIAEKNGQRLLVLEALQTDSRTKCNPSSLGTHSGDIVARGYFILPQPAD